MKDPKLVGYYKYIMLLVAAVLIFLAGFFTGGLSIGSEGVSFGPNDQVLIGNKNGPSTVNVDILWEAWENLDNFYIEKDLDKQEMLYGAIDGMVNSVGDRYNVYFTPADTEDYNDESGGQFEGIGAMLRFDGEYTVIDTPIDGFPAQKAGLRAGDVILKVDDKDMKGLKPFDVAEKIKGPKDTEVKIDIYRIKDEKEYSFKIIRKAIDIDNIELKEVKDGIARIKINRFNESDDYVFYDLWNKAVDDAINKGADKFVIDLRNNPGGRVDFVKYVAEEFLKNGDTIFMEENRDGHRKVTRAGRNGRLRDKEVVIIVNEGSASASEILCGALRDNRNVKIIGMPTVGKGVEQILKTLSDGSTMHIVFQKWLTPNGTQVTAEDPIKPDIEIDLTTEDFEQNKDPQLDKALEELKK